MHTAKEPQSKCLVEVLPLYAEKGAEKKAVQHKMYQPVDNDNEKKGKNTYLLSRETDGNDFSHGEAPRREEDRRDQRGGSEINVEDQRGQEKK